MVSRLFSILLLFFIAHILISQEANSSYTDSEWHEKYLNSKEKPEVLIQALLDKIPEADLAQSLKYLQIAFTLEKRISEPLPVLFELNFRAAQIIAKLNKEHAMSFFEKATGIVSKIEDRLVIGRVYYMYTDRAFNHHALAQIDSAIFYLNKAIETARRMDGSTEASALNNMGIFYAKIGDDITARKYYQRAYDLFLQESDDHFLGKMNLL